MIRQTLRESLLIVTCATVAGLGATALTGQGLFSDKPLIPSVQDRAARLGVPMMIPLGDAQTLYESGNAVFVDSRHAYDYRLGHIRGAVSLPLEDVDNNTSAAGQLSKDATLVVYCDGAECNSSIELAAKLYVKGFRNIKIFFGGWQEWRAAGLPTDGGAS